MATRLAQLWEQRPLGDGAALALSGGGYRAGLFHLGALWRMNELGGLKRLQRIDGVSGGAIAAAWLGLQWHTLRFDDRGTADNFREAVAQPLMQLCSRTLDVPVGLAALAWPISVLPLALARQIFGKARLTDLPHGTGAPEVCVLATNLLTGAIAEFSHAGIQEECLGAYAWPELPLAHAVAASCSVPPSFRPVTLRLDPQRWLGPCPPRYERTRRRPAALRLVDGGNYDNLALSRVWDRYSYVLASVGSSPMLPWTWVSGDWLTATLRSNRILIDEVRDLRLRELQERNRLHGGQHCVFWTIDDDPQRFAAPGSLACASNTASRLARMRTRLGRHTAAEQGQLINWGYAACDAALRKGLVPDAPPPAGWPVPEHALN